MQNLLHQFNIMIFKNWTVLLNCSQSIWTDLDWRQNSVNLVSSKVYLYSFSESRLLIMLIGAWVKDTALWPKYWQWRKFEPWMNILVLFIFTSIHIFSCFRKLNYMLHYHVHILRFYLRFKNRPILRYNNILVKNCEKCLQLRRRLWRHNKENVLQSSS
jgi:hypothetical protein